MSLTPTETTTMWRRGECVDRQGQRPEPVPSRDGGWRVVARAQGCRVASRSRGEQRQYIIAPSAAARGRSIISPLANAQVGHNVQVLRNPESLAGGGRAMISLTCRGEASGVDCTAVPECQRWLRCGTAGAQWRAGLELAA